MNPEGVGFFDELANGKAPVNYAQFYYHPVKNNFKSEQEGRDIFEDRVYILIMSPGQSKTEVRRACNAQDKEDYRAAWNAFSQNKPQPISGTPIECLPGLTPSRVQELISVNVRTIEQMAEVSDLNLYNIGMDGHKLRATAKAMIEKNMPVIDQLKFENADLRKRLEALEAALAKDDTKPQGKTKAA